MDDKVKDLIATAEALRSARKCEDCEDGYFAVEINGESLKAACGLCNATGEIREPFPRVLTGVEPPDMSKMLSPGMRAQGSLVKVRLAGSTDEEPSTRLGILLGDLPTGVGGKFDAEGKLTLAWSGGNPAIWVPSLKRIVRGYESWWGLIESAEELKSITDSDIAAIPYVQAIAATEGCEAVVKNASVTLGERRGNV